MTDREVAIAELKAIEVQLHDIIKQLEEGKDVVYYSSPEIASFINGIHKMAWGAGTNPENGIRSFTGYFRDY